MFPKLNSLRISGADVLPLIEGGKGVAITTGASSGAWAAAGGVGTFSGVNADSYDKNSLFIKNRDKELLSEINHDAKPNDIQNSENFKSEKEMEDLRMQILDLSKVVGDLANSIKVSQVEPTKEVIEKNKPSASFKKTSKSTSVLGKHPLKVASAGLFGIAIPWLILYYP